MKLYIFNKKIKHVRAFTLLETLVSIAVVSTVIMGPLMIAVNSSAYARQSKDTMASTYLAEEAIELVHYQYLSYYIACHKNKAPCKDVNIPPETTSETAWRMFKSHFSATAVANSGVSCFTASGCAFDFSDMSATSSSGIYTFNPTAVECSQLSLLTTINASISRKIYTCGYSELARNASGVQVFPHYSRKITIESLSTFEPGAVSLDPNLGLYQDDLRVTATVSFKRSNGSSKSIKIVDFIHARS